MTLDLAAAQLRNAAEQQPWRQPEEYWPALTVATREFSAPVVAVGLEALSYNVHDMLRRAGGLPIRVASKSVRVRAVLDAVLALPGYHGVLGYSLEEALWLSDSVTDIVVAYPTADRNAIARLAADERAASRITLMVDSAEQLDLIDDVVPPAKRNMIRLCLDFDASWRSPGLGHIGVLRSPIHTAKNLREFAEWVSRRPGFQVVGVMSYEAQIAGVGDDPRNKPATGLLMRTVQRASRNELVERRADAIERVRQIIDLDFVNGGGTGSIERTVAEESITEVAAGSGLFGSHLFDNYRDFTPAPAAAFALDVVRRPNADTATLLGGGWIASGPPGPDRLPRITWPEGLAYAPREAAGEVQTPVVGRAARNLRIGDRVWMRATKAGEPMERTEYVVPVADGVALDPLPTYRGEGRCFG